MFITLLLFYLFMFVIKIISLYIWLCDFAPSAYQLVISCAPLIAVFEEKPPMLSVGSGDLESMPSPESDGVSSPQAPLCQPEEDVKTTGSESTWNSNASAANFLWTQEQTQIVTGFWAHIWTFQSLLWWLYKLLKLKISFCNFFYIVCSVFLFTVPMVLIKLQHFIFLCCGY